MKGPLKSEFIMVGVEQVVGDAQTTLTSLGGGIAGVAADQLGSYVIAQAGGGKADLAHVAMDFAARSVVSAAAFGAVQSLMPETSSNVFFSILFFAANKGLMSSAVAVSYGVVNAVTGTMRSVSMPKKSRDPAGGGPGAPMYPQQARGAMPCGLGSCY